MGAPVLVLFFFLQDSIFFKFIVRLLFGINFNKLMLVPLWWGCVYFSVPEDTAQHRWVRKNGDRVWLLPPLQQAQLCSPSPAKSLST